MGPQSEWNISYEAELIESEVDLRNHPVVLKILGEIEEDALEKAKDMINEKIDG